MTRTEKIKVWESKITKIVAGYKRISDACNAAVEVGAMDINGPLHEAIWVAYEGVLEYVDIGGWIQWYIYDNDCGKRKRAAAASGKNEMRPIKTPRDLAKLIVEEEELFTERPIR